MEIAAAPSTKVNGIDIEELGLMVEAIEADPAEARVEFRVRTGWCGGARSESLVETLTIGSESVARRFRIVADEPLELCGTDTAPNPQELLIAAINACMTIGYVANAALRGVALTGLEIEMRGQLDLRGFLGLGDDAPAGCRELHYVARIAGDGTAEQYREIHETVMRTSPNYLNMAQPIRLDGRVELC